MGEPTYPKRPPTVDPTVAGECERCTITGGYLDDTKWPSPRPIHMNSRGSALQRVEVGHVVGIALGRFLPLGFAAERLVVIYAPGENGSVSCQGHGVHAPNSNLNNANRAGIQHVVANGIPCDGRVPLFLDHNAEAKLATSAIAKDENI